MTRPAPQAPKASCEPRIVLVTVPHCHLCNRARRVVEEVAAQAHTSWRELDLLTEGAADPSWWDLVPVVLVDGRVAASLHVEAGPLQAALRGAR